MGVERLQELRDRVAEAALQAAPGEWITGYGLAYDVFAETGIRGSLLAEATGDTPALLSFADLHSALATPLALRLAGIIGPREFDEPAEIVVEEGLPTGELHEEPAISLVLDAVPDLTPGEIYRQSAINLRRLAAAGITGVHAMDGDLSRLELLGELEGNGDLVTRVVLPYWLKPGSDQSLWKEFVAARDAGGRRWRTGVAKFFIDGVIEAGTAWLFEPDSRGESTQPFWPDPTAYGEGRPLYVREGLPVRHACDRGPCRPRGARRIQGGLALRPEFATASSTAR